MIQYPYFRGQIFLKFPEPVHPLFGSSFGGTTCQKYFFWTKKISLSIPALYAFCLVDMFMIAGWWFQTFFIFHNIWDNPSHRLISFRGVGQSPTRWTMMTNQLLIGIVLHVSWPKNVGLVRGKLYRKPEGPRLSQLWYVAKTLRMIWYFDLGTPNR